MNTYALFFSPTKTTKRVVETIAKGIDKNYNSLSITLPDERKINYSFKENDTVVFGVPVYSGRIPDCILDYINTIKGENTKIILIAVYGNRHFDDTLVEMEDITKNNGFRVISAAAFIGEHSFTAKVANNRPDEKDLEIAYNFGLELKNIIKKDNIKLIIPGNRPYREKKPAVPMAPVVSEKCNECKKCVDGCPVGAISYNNKIIIDENKCIRCNSCIKNCPVGAISFMDQLINPINWLESNCMETRKEPDVFLGVCNE